MSPSPPCARSPPPPRRPRRAVTAPAASVPRTRNAHCVHAADLDLLELGSGQVWSVMASPVFVSVGVMQPGRVGPCLRTSSIDHRLGERAVGNRSLERGVALDAAAGALVAAPPRAAPRPNGSRAPRRGSPCPGSAPPARGTSRPRGSPRSPRSRGPSRHRHSRTSWNFVLGASAGVAPSCSTVGDSASTCSCSFSPICFAISASFLSLTTPRRSPRCRSRPRGIRASARS